MKSKILIIDDQAEIRENIHELLRISGYETYTAKDGFEGIKAAQEVIPDLILCDVMMPNLDGYGVLRILENIPELESVPFIFLTGRTGLSDIRKGMELGADDYLLKPFDVPDLLNSIQARLKKNRALYEKTRAKVNQDQLFTKAPVHKKLCDILALKNERHVKEKECIFREGDVFKSVYCIRKGKVKVVKANESGKELIASICNEGELFGYESLINNNQRFTTTAIAMENGSVIQIPKDEFLTLLKTNSEMLTKFIVCVTSRLIDMEERIIGIAYDTARVKVANAIIYVSSQCEPNQEVPGYLAISREDISCLTGLTIETVSRNITSLKEDRYIEVEHNKIKIMDLGKLKELKY